MNRSDFSFDVEITKNGKFYKNFNLPATTNAIIFGDLFNGHLDLSQVGSVSTATLTTSTTNSPFSITVKNLALDVGNSIAMKELPILHPKS